MRRQVGAAELVIGQLVQGYTDDHRRGEGAQVARARSAAAPPVEIDLHFAADATPLEPTEPSVLNVQTSD